MGWNVGVCGNLVPSNIGEGGGLHSAIVPSMAGSPHTAVSARSSLHTVVCTQRSVHCSVVVHCSLCTVALQCRVYTSEHSALSVHSSVQSAHTSPLPAVCTLKSVHCSLCASVCTQPPVHCSVHAVVVTCGLHTVLGPMLHRSRALEPAPPCPHCTGLHASAPTLQSRVAACALYSSIRAPAAWPTCGGWQRAPAPRTRMRTLPISLHERRTCGGWRRAPALGAAGNLELEAGEGGAFKFALNILRSGCALCTSARPVGAGEEHRPWVERSCLSALNALYER